MLSVKVYTRECEHFRHNIWQWALMPTWEKRVNSKLFRSLPQCTVQFCGNDIATSDQFYASRLVAFFSFCSCLFSLCQVQSVILCVHVSYLPSHCLATHCTIVSALSLKHENKVKERHSNVSFSRLAFSSFLYFYALALRARFLSSLFHNSLASSLNVSCTDNATLTQLAWIRKICSTDIVTYWSHAPVT